MNRRLSLTMLWLLACLLPQLSMAQARLIISQYYEGTSFNKWIEVTNVGNAAFDPSSTALYLCLNSNPRTEADLSSKLQASLRIDQPLAVGQSLLYKNSQATLPAYASGTASGVVNFNGDDIVYLSTANTAATAWAARTDVVGALKGDGNLNLFGADRSFVRKPEISAPAASWTLTEWSEASLSEVDAALPDVSARLGYHLKGSSTPPTDPTPTSLVFFQEKFDDCQAPSRGWTFYDVSSNAKWACTPYGKDNSQGLQANNYGADADAEDWLISPQLRPAAIQDCQLSFWVRTKFSGPDVQVLYTTSYTPGASPASTSWTPLPIALPAANSDTWTEVKASLASVNGPIYIAFKYTGGSTSGTSQRFTLDDFSLQGKAGASLSFNPSLLRFQQTEQVLAYQVEGKDISQDLQVDAPAGWQLSADGQSWQTSLSVPALQLPKQLQVRLAADPGTSVQGSLVHRSASLAADYALPLTYTAPPIPRDNTFDIATWNLEWFGTPEKSGHATSFPQQLEAVSSKLLELNADVYALQEVTEKPGQNHLQQLVDKLNELTAPGTFSGHYSQRYSYYWQAFDPAFPPQKTAYIYRNATVSVKGSRNFFSDVYTGESSAYPAGYPGGKSSSFWASGRLPFELAIEARIQGISQPLYLVNLHAKAMADSKERRAFDGGVLLDSLKAAQYADKNVIVLGDFNDYLNGSTGGGTSPYAPWLNETYFKEAAGKSIDHLLISNELYDEFQAAGNSATYSSTQISDHDPILISLKLNQEPKIPLLVSVQDSSKVYGQPDPTSFLLAYSGFVGNDGPEKLQGTPSFSIVGDTIKVEGLSSDLYDIRYQFGTMRLLDAPLTAILSGGMKIVLKDQVKFIGGKHAQVTVAYEGLVNGDGPEVVQGTPIFSAVNGEVIVSGLYAPHYAIRYVDNTRTLNDGKSAAQLRAWLQQAIALFPNPCRGPFTLRWDESLGAMAEVRICHMGGREVWKGSVANQQQVDASRWQPGLYFLQVQWEGIVHQLPLIIR